MAVALDAVSPFFSFGETKRMTDIFFQACRDFARRLRVAYRGAPVRAWLCLAAFLLSFSYALLYRIEPTVDARRYHTVATNLVQKGTFCETCDVPLAKDTAIHGVGPGYQFFLAGIYKIFGIHPWVVWLLQALMHTAVVWWAWGLATKVIPKEKRGKWTFILPFTLLAVHPDILQNNAMLMTDGLFTFLLVASIRLFIVLWERLKLTGRHLRLIACLGLFLGALTMVRPTGVPLAVLIAAVLVWKRRFALCGLLVGMFILVQVPWNVRNLNVYHKFIFNSVVGGLDVWVGLYPKGPGEFNMDALPEIANRISGLDAEEVERVSLQEAKKIIVDKPLFALGRTVQKSLKLFALSKTSAFWFHYSGAWDRLAVLVTSILFNLTLLGMFFASLWDAMVRRRFHHWILGLSVVIVALLAISPTLTVVVNRYRIPMLPFMAIASVGWLAFVTGKDRRNSLIAAVAILLLTTTVDVWGSMDKVRERLLRFR